MHALPLERYRVGDYVCPKGHTGRRNRWLQDQASIMCLQCFGLDQTMVAIFKILKIECVEVNNSDFRTASHKYPSLHTPENLYFLCTCFNAHVWGSTLRDLLEGRGCLKCLVGKKHPRDYVVEVLEAVGSTPLNLYEDPFQGNIHFIDEYSNPRSSTLEVLIYGEKSSNDWALKTRDGFRDAVAPSALKICPLDTEYTIREHSCHRGHKFRTAPFLMKEPWCDQCDGELVINKVLKNAGGKARPLVDGLTGRGFVDILDKEALSKGPLEFKCSEGHVWAGFVYKVVRGEWCDFCLAGVYQSDPNRKELAKRFGARYQASKGNYVCLEGCIIAHSTEEILRGARCDRHPTCRMFWQKAGAKTPTTLVTHFKENAYVDLVFEVLKLDVNFKLAFSDILTTAKKFHDLPARSVYLLTKHNTPEKIQYMARSRGGKCLTVDVANFKGKMNWTCGTEHEKDVIYTWEDDLLSILEGSWCRICLGPDVCTSKGPLSKGEQATELYLRAKGWPCITQKTFSGCIYKKLLRFDFYVPHLNLLIEFDGIQHFKPVKMFGGEETFIDQKIKDSIKERYCIDNGIRLWRIRNVKRVNEDLDDLWNKHLDVVMLINMQGKKEFYPLATIMDINDSYFAVCLKA